MKRMFFVTCLLTIFIAFNACSTLKKSAKNKEQLAVISTDFGDIKIKLYNGTPLHRDNFIKLVEEQFYDGTLFHRVQPLFMIQGGDPSSKSNETPIGSVDVGYTIPAEIVPEYYHKRGALAAARKPNEFNPKKESSGSQFFIVVGDNYHVSRLNRTPKGRAGKYTELQEITYKTLGGTPFLDGEYTVFGEVVEGMEVVDKIAVTPRFIENDNRPAKDVKMTIRLVKE